MLMKMCSFARAAALSLGLASLPGATMAATGDSWEIGASIYGWLPDISGQTMLSDRVGGSEFEVDVKDILRNLKFTFMGTLDARKGRFGALTDVIYMSVGKSDANFREGTVGGTQIPTDATLDIDFDMKSWIWTAAGYYRAAESESSTFDVLAGFRYIDVKQTLDWSFTGNVGQIPLPDRDGSAKGKLSNWDFIVGLRGRFGLGGNWLLPMYLDLGAGESDFTLQALGGIAYAFKWGEVAAAWRYLEYDLDSDNAIADINFSGPAVGVTFHW